MMRIFFCIIAAYSISAKASPPDIKFPVKKISLSKHIIKVEIAETQEQQARGLMFRTKLSQDSGMLFIYSNESILNFWMKNTFIPLSIGFFDKNQRLIDVQDMAPVTTELQVKVPSYQSARPAMYALEMNKGWFSRNQIPLKTKFKFIKK